MPTKITAGGRRRRPKRDRHRAGRPPSPITDAVAQPDLADQLLDLLATVPDPRDPRGVRHPLAGILAVAVTAVRVGARSFAAAGEWAADLPREHLIQIGLGSSATPDESTLRTLFDRLDADELERVLGAWVSTRSSVINGQRVIALDGKTVRGARTTMTGAPHLVAALDHTTSTVVGQVAGKVATAPAWVGFAGAAQVAQVRRTVTHAGKKSGIENRLHWVRAPSSACCASPAGTTSPRLYDTTPATRTALTRLLTGRTRPFRGPGFAPRGACACRTQRW